MNARHLAAVLLGVLAGAPSVNAQSAWTRLTPAASPSLRGGISGSSDGSRFLMFGGQTSGGVYLDDLWGFDGTAWTDLTPAAGLPPARDWHGQAFDSARGRLVVFGGRNGATIYGDTWEWDGSAWTQATTANAPTARRNPGMTYDSARGVIVLFGGEDGATRLNDTWEYDGTDWTQVTPAQSPPARWKMQIAYDSDRGLVVVAGGNVNGGGRGNDTWTYDGTNWTEVVGAGAPFGTGLENCGMAYDAVRKRCVLQGGFNGSYRSKTFDFDGSTWIDRGNFLGQGLTGRTGNALAFVPAIGKVILFGGFASSAFVDETYEWSTPTPASFATSGTGCASAVGQPTLSITADPWCGDSFELVVDNLGAGSLAFMLLGASSTLWPAGALPQPLTFLGAPNCLLYTSVEEVLSAPVVAGEARFAYGVPDLAVLYGATCYAQCIGFDGNLRFTTGRGDLVLGGY
ncbi:MAG: Kelch repeat-containing protein [Planctomycetota bacterium]